VRRQAALEGKTIEAKDLLDVYMEVRGCVCVCVRACVCVVCVCVCSEGRRRVACPWSAGEPS
jgi:hypothetical protein